MKKILKRIIGTQQLVHNTDIIKNQLNTYLDDIVLNQNLIASYPPSTEIERNIYTINKCKYLLKMFNENLFFFINKFNYINHSDEYFSICGIKLSSRIPERDMINSCNTLRDIFLRSFGILLFFDDNYDHNIVIPAEYVFGHIRQYKDEQIDVTIKTNDIVIDAGAWIGDFSSYASSKGATTYAFEPTQHTFSSLKHTACLNKNIIPENMCLSDKIGVENFIDYTDTLNSACNKIVKSRTNQTIEVKSITLDKYVIDNNLPKVDFIKADIEGAERYMLLGSEYVIKKFAPKLSIATYHLDDDKEIIKNIILNFNPTYKIKQLNTMLYASGEPI